jgi:hypothetical protein
MRLEERAGHKGEHEMAEYLVLIYDNEARFAESDAVKLGKMNDGHAAFQAKHGAALRGGNALQPTTTATTIRQTDNGFTTTDGPFAETKEALGGYYLIEAADLDAAIAIAKDIPTIDGCLEVRPVLDLSGSM